MILTLEAMIEPAWQIMLYTALPTVRVRTEPAFREIKLTKRRVMLETETTNQDERVLTVDRVDIGETDNQHSEGIPAPCACTGWKKLQSQQEREAP